METTDATSLVESFRASLSYPASLHAVISTAASLIAADPGVKHLDEKGELATLFALTSIVSYHLQEPVSSGLVHAMLTPKAITFPADPIEDVFKVMKEVLLFDDDLLNDSDQIDAWLVVPNRKAAAFPHFQRNTSVAPKPIETKKAPESLCPFCDKVLPTSLPKRLSTLMAELAKMGTPEPRESNAAGLSLFPKRLNHLLLSTQ